MADHHIGVSRLLVQKNELVLELFIQQGIFKPIFIFQIVFFNLLPLVGLVLPRHGVTKYIRPAVFVACLAFAIEILSSRRAHLGANGYMVGLMTAWWLVWTATLYIFADVEKDYRRIERDDGPDLSKDHGNSSKAAKYHWQSYPPKFMHRLEWCAGLIFNLRGPEWNWRAPRLGPLPRSVYAQLQSGFISKEMQQENDEDYVTPKQRVQQGFRSFLIGYLSLDILKAVMMRDPYFRGDLSNAGRPFPISYLENVPLAIRSYHVFTSAVGVYTALSFVTALNPIFFLGLSSIFPNASRRLTGAPLDASWLYADTFGPFFSPLLEDGLAGLWGQWWHQLFRHGFTSTARWILSLMPRKWRTNPRVKRVTFLVVAFSLSGLIHASGSYTQFTKTRPLTGPFLFFAMQSIAVIVESIFKNVLLPKTPLASAPRWFCRAANVIWVFFWLLFSGPFITDDFATGGIWLVEPIPFSPLRGLGLAVGQGWWCWQGPWFRHWSDGTYWGSGIRMV
ncbi:hypothetical protein N7468_008124 [Penicillium chermesinum]|uniref:Wax synthase domain-containing protein n=1 Tax=Penicillium chermesinum TaxID=63820 RepID=A0A9W9NP59_9EURO|nr:uncharacterized protein N7468_008124 [Penicillium chermesinum]KAJ5223582.1 hypothetical protein N7468_008124 [Penicillium chermesinum]